MNFPFPSTSFPATPPPERPSFIDVEEVRASIEAQAKGHLEPVQSPSIVNMAANFSGSLANWARNGFGTVSDSTIQSRLDICKGCEFWNADGFKGTGRCQKCGCSTWAKLRMATEKCPLDKWGPVNTPTPELQQPSTD